MASCVIAVGSFKMAHPLVDRGKVGAVGCRGCTHQASSGPQSMAGRLYCNLAKQKQCSQEAGSIDITMRMDPG